MAILSEQEQHWKALAQRYEKALAAITEISAKSEYTRSQGLLTAKNIAREALEQKP